MDLQSLPNVILGDTEYSAGEVLHALNYGISPLFSRLVEIKEDIKELLCIWDDALLVDFNQCLYGSGYHSLQSAFENQAATPTKFGARMLSEDVHILLAILIHYSGAFSDQYFVFPHSYHVRELIGYVRYVQGQLPQQPVLGVETTSAAFFVEMKEFWKTTFGRLHWNF